MRPATVKLHPTAIIDPRAQLAQDVEVGPYSVIGPDVVIGPGCWIGPHAVITGHTRMGARNRIFQHSSLGEIPQDKKYGGEATRLEIGDDNTIREFCTFNCGTAQDVGVTRVGNGNWIMAYVHVAHDCQVSNHTILANGVQLGGHVHIGEYAILGGLTGVHQFCHIGAHSITGAGTVVLKDIPPFVTVSGNPGKPYGLNVEGLKRRGFAAPTITKLKRAYKTLYRSGLTIEQAMKELERQSRGCPEVRVTMDFLAAATRGVVR
ncbi:MAG: UDP-N-acetylglucosamine acyltransferase [Betaproteobacteria bacterium SG8_41]|nr:MAG: UDP-N-acetylglucosamine acyltransferase [Betaproteobacteria bacterium SG8_41]